MTGRSCISKRKTQIAGYYYCLLDFDEQLLPQVPIEIKIKTPDTRATSWSRLLLAEPSIIPAIDVTAETIKYTAKKIILSFFTTDI
jgi:hypothetical protein